MENNLLLSKLAWVGGRDVCEEYPSLFRGFILYYHSITTAALQVNIFLLDKRYIIDYLFPVQKLKVDLSLRKYSTTM